MADWFFLTVLAVGCLLAAVFTYLMYGMSVQEDEQVSEPECYLCGLPIRDGEDYRHVVPGSPYLVHKYCPYDEDEDDEPRFLEQRPA